MKDIKTYQDFHGKSQKVIPTNSEKKQKMKVEVYSMPFSEIEPNKEN